MSYPANPNPARITDELWRFRCDMLALEPGSDDEDSGIYANKPGYHNTRAQNASDNYSVRDAADQKGPSDKAAAWDWTFRSAQNGDYSRIAIYGKRFKAAFDARDPRCNVLREFLGQTDTDTTPEGLDFRYHSTRTPDSSHEWHDHFSFVRAYVAVVGALDGVLSVAKGETLDAYRARGGKLYKIDGTGEMEMDDMLTEAQAQMLHVIGFTVENAIARLQDPYTVPAATFGTTKYPGYTGPNPLAQRLDAIEQRLDAIEQRLNASEGGGAVAGPMSISLSGSVSLSGTATPAVQS